MITIPRITCPLYPNSNKAHEMHPDLRGKLLVEEQPLDVALWTRTTKDKRRMYHSATISPSWQKGETTTIPLAKGLKLYEFRKRREGDPDFQGPEPFTLLGKPYTLALWVEVGAPEELEELKFSLALLDKPYSESLSGECAETMAALKERIKAKATEEAEAREFATQQEERATEMAQEHARDQIPGLDEEPSDLPF